MNHLKFFIWNDIPAKAERIKAILAGKETKSDEMRIAVCSFTDLQLIVDACLAFGPDVIILDIVHEYVDKQLGLHIAAEIRKRDRLVPILAVTMAPKVVYLMSTEFSELDFAGVFHQSVVEDGVLEAVALRPSLNLWHLYVPDFPLVRRSILALNEAFPQTNVPGSGDSINKCIEDLTAILTVLPFARSNDAWHALAQAPLQRCLKRRDLPNVSKAYEKMADLFQKSDRIYMAGSRSRRHLSHNVQVFLLGLYILIKWKALSALAIASVRRIRPDENESACLLDAILIWACIAMTHDTAYLSEDYVNVVHHLIELGDMFRPGLLSTDNAQAPSVPTWPDTYHGEVAARLWSTYKDSPNIRSGEGKFIDLISSGIRRHDSKQFPDPVATNEWQCFLAVLSDELQDWGRDRPEITFDAKDNWGMFCLEGIDYQSEIVDSKSVSKLSFTFIARQHPNIVSLKFPRAARESVHSRIDRIGNNLRQYLRSPDQMEINLAVDFVTGDEMQPIDEAYTIPSE